ncbi:hypothetical protein [Streptomyces sp. H39-S7]|uniref:hypothetical protein n=1 Tax=Streptomyces sp. H39-S7 TaxID=3004357 RepID=UPI0022B046F4|nr:hypothetical protein [Streptomyces sp. H39-S7]MCZ4121391.1 hypothetical protein [Streptomyces sp. H39-S7]
MKRLQQWGVAGGLALAAFGGVVACDPASGMTASAVSITTDQLGTRALKDHGVDVQWMSCSASVNSATTATRTTSPRPSGATTKGIASVDCQGETTDRQAIIVTGRVTEQLDGRCVRGRLTAKVGQRTVFDVNGLGDCTATSGPTGKTSAASARS